MPVTVNAGKWVNQPGTLLSAIPNSQWFNVRIPPTLTLVLYQHEFTLN